MNFELEDNDVAVNILDNYSMVNGLNLIGCSFIDIDASSDATNGNRALHSSGQNPEDCAKNVVIQGCYFKDLHQGIKINCLENLTVTDNQFYGIKAHTMLLNGTKSNVGGVIEIRDNKIGISMGERFIRATSIAANAEITVSGNIVTDGIPMGADDDIVKITGIHADATVTVDNTNSWNGKTVTIG
ncbi:MAG: hypothetical protein J6R83_02820 [Clostridia bacterium]|nr:hypothetical protein [Clostridia bacterium]